jgi:hypothetical protein
MSRRRFHFLDRMNEGKAIAAARRNRGLAVGCHVSWQRKRSDEDPEGGACPFAVIAADAKARYADVKAAFRFDVCGDQWEGL